MNSYEDQLLKGIREAGITPSLRGIEYGEGIVREVDIDRPCVEDTALGRFVNYMRRHIAGRRRL
jgi:hypothetical protein